MKQVYRPDTALLAELASTHAASHSCWGMSWIPTFNVATVNIGCRKKFASAVGKFLHDLEAHTDTFSAQGAGHCIRAGGVRHVMDDGSPMTPARPIESVWYGYKRAVFANRLERCRERPTPAASAHLGL